MICDLCSTEYDDEERVCTSCGAPNPAFRDEELSDEEIAAEVDAGEALVPQARSIDLLTKQVNLDDEIEQGPVEPVFRASTEMVAAIIKGLLESEGIPVIVASRQVPWMDGVMTMAEGFYGDLLVPQSEAERARTLIEAYEATAQGDEK